MITGGLNVHGSIVTDGLNPSYGIVVTPADLAEVKVFVIADGVATLIAPIGIIHVNDEDSFHKDEDPTPASLQHTESGVDPGPNPPSIWKPDAEGSDDDT